MSKAYIAYCTCTRAGSPSIVIAACFTQGDSDYLFVGRHGVFYDRSGRDWDAVITSIVDNPVSIAQAFWSPYKKFLRMIEEQVAKRAAAAEAESTAKLAATAEKTANADKTAPAAAAIVVPRKFDLALITGIGVAIGSIATFFGVILTKSWTCPRGRCRSCWWASCWRSPCPRWPSLGSSFASAPSVPSSKATAGP